MPGDHPREGSTVRMVRGGAFVTVGKQLGQGGQGVVVLATLGTRTLALKWFRPQTLLVEWRRTIQKLVERSKPEHPAFVWPIDLVVSDETPGFGYVMPYVGPPFMPFAKMLRAERQPDIRVLLAIARELVEAFEALHSSGLCYRDISWGNLLVNPESSEVAIIDNDNVAVDGEPAFVAGTLRFMAPEIIREEAQPSMVTDLHSLAVFLFWLLCHGHPLEGGRSDASLSWSGGHVSETELLRRFLGYDPIFVFDPADSSNRPPPGDPMLAWWRIYPPFFRQLFEKAFTAGLRDASLVGRVPEGVWRRGLLRLQDSCGACDACGATIFWDPRAPATPCWRCSKVPEEPMLLALNGHQIVLSPGAVVTGHHLLGNKDYRRVVGVVEAHPTRPVGVLRNRSELTWSISPEGEEPKPVPPGKAAAIRPMDIEIGPRTGRVGKAGSPEMATSGRGSRRASAAG